MEVRRMRTSPFFTQWRGENRNVTLRAVDPQGQLALSWLAVDQAHFAVLSVRRASRYAAFGA